MESLERWVSKMKELELIKELLNFPGWEEVLNHYDEAGGMVCEEDKWKFLGKFLGGVAGGNAVYLGSAEWGDREWDQVKIQPGHDGCIMIPTGGTTGGVKFAMHRWENLVASVERTRSYLGVETIDSVCLLPLWHVSGLMAVLRSLLTGGRVRFDEGGSGGYLSLVPTQLKRYIEKDVGWLRELDGVFVGGSRVDVKLMDRARELGINVMDVYGMTETVAMVLADGRPMPGVDVRLNEKGRVEVKCESLFYGYYPDEPKKKDWWETGDLGEVDSVGRLRIRGRADGIIITGGEKVDPEEVERVIMGSGLVEEVVVKGEPDIEWGSRVVAICKGGEGEKEALEVYLREHLQRWQVPKEIRFA